MTDQKPLPNLFLVHSSAWLEKLKEEGCVSVVASATDYPEISQTPYIPASRIEALVARVKGENYYGSDYVLCLINELEQLLKGAE